MTTSIGCFLLAAFIGLVVITVIFTLAGIITLLTDRDYKAYIIRIKREYGYVFSPFRLGAIFQSIRWSLGASYWKPVENTIMYGWPIFLLQFFKLKTNADKEAQKLALYTKLINKETGYDR